MLITNSWDNWLSNVLIFFVAQKTANVNLPPPDDSVNGGFLKYAPPRKHSMAMGVETGIFISEISIKKYV